MARKIIILSQSEGAGRDTELSVAFWLDVVAVSRQPYYAGVGTSVVGATQAEEDAITAGEVVERIMRYTRPPGTTNNQIKTFLEARYAEEQAALTADTTYRFAGTSWDGTAWTNSVNDA